METKILIDNLNPLRDKGILPYNKEKEDEFLKYKTVVNSLISSGFLTTDEGIKILSIVRRDLGLPFFISKESNQLDKITL